MRSVFTTDTTLQLIEAVCIDHFYLDNVCLFSVMHHYSSNFAVQIIATTSLAETVVAQCCLSHTMRGDLVLRYHKINLLLIL